jgi:hypothetical protein
MPKVEQAEHRVVQQIKMIADIPLDFTDTASMCGA